MVLSVAVRGGANLNTHTETYGVIQWSQKAWSILPSNLNEWLDRNNLTKLKSVFESKCNINLYYFSAGGFGFFKLLYQRILMSQDLGERKCLFLHAQGWRIENHMKKTNWKFPGCTWCKRGGGTVTARIEPCITPKIFRLVSTAHIILPYNFLY